MTRIKPPLAGTKKCACGTIMDLRRIDCGSPKCVARTLEFDADRPERTERFSGLRQDVEFNHKVDTEAAPRLQENAYRTLRKVTRDLYDETLRLKYAQMRREEGIE